MIKNFNFLYIFFLIFIFSKSLFSYEIKFNGLQKLNISDIQAITQVDVFKPSLKKNELNSIIEDLYTSDLIFDVNLALTDKLATVNVTESKIIKNIYINNNTFIKDNIILNLLTSFENSLLNKNKIIQDIEIIENIYISSGYKNIRANASTEKVTNNTINLIFNIQEGPSSTIGNISFVGNNFFSDRYLNGIIQSETNSFFSIFSSGSNFNEELFNFDKELIVSNYRNEGFFDVNVSFELTENIFNRYNLVYFIDENIRSKISNIKLDISSSSLSDNFQSIIDDFEVQLSKNNFFYSKNSIQLVLGKLDKVLEKNLINNSYFSSSININNNKIQITFVENKTPLIKVNKIDITGNSITKTKTIRSNISISPGDYYFEKNIINSKQKLIAKKYINQVEINQNFSDKYVDLVFDIQENKKTGNFLLGGSFSGDTGLGAAFSIKDYNIFGTGNEIESSINLNSESALFKIIFSQTPISNSSLKNTYTIFNEENDITNSYGYKTQSQGIGYNLLFSYSKNLNINFGISASNLRGYSGKNSQSYINDNIGNFQNILFDYSMFYNNTNNILFPTSGHDAQLKFTISPNNISDDSYFKLSTSSSLYFNNKKSNNFLFLSNKLGLADSIDGNLKTNNTFSLGGLNFKGFDYRGIGPFLDNTYLGGNKFFTSTFGYGSNFLFDQKDNVYLKTFITTGSIWESDYSQNDEFKLRTSVGISFDILTPVAPLTVSYAIPILKTDSDIKRSFNFSLGTSF